MAILKFSAPATVNWFKPKSGLYSLDVVARQEKFKKLQGVYVIGCQRLSKSGKTKGKPIPNEFDAISVGEGEIGNRLSAKSKEQKYAKRADGRTMRATFADLSKETDEYRRRVELYLGKYYGLDKMGDTFHTSLKPIRVNPPWKK